MLTLERLAGAGQVVERAADEGLLDPILDDVVVALPCARSCVVLT